MPNTPQYTWDPKLKRYRSAETGKLVSEQLVRAALDQAVLTANKDIAALTAQLVKGKLSLAEWQAQMAVQLKTYHTAAGLAANGGIANMTPELWGALGAKLRKQYQYLQQMALDLERGKTPLTAYAVQRAELYTEAMRGTYESMRRANKRGGDYAQERRVLGAADHCDCCLAQADMGWQDIGTLLEIGDCDCGSRCHCVFEYM